jgi:hypothetical protein
MKTEENNQHGPQKLLVMVTSNDGHMKHPFDGTATVGEVRAFAYERLVRQTEQTPFNQTWIECSGQRLADSTVLDTLATRHPGDGNDPDLTLALTWATVGGWRV